MKIHKEGKRIILFVILLMAVVVTAVFCIIPIVWIQYLIALCALLKICFVVRFFRVPSRDFTEKSQCENSVFSPADGTVVAIEQVEESEFLGDQRIQVSVFMSVWNVHINWFPVCGKVVYFKYHPGKFLVAWLPKSSELNERTTTVVETPKGEKILFRQIAGFVARRIVNYANVGEKVECKTEVGFIKFGSRVDVFLPIGTKVNVKINDKVIGGTTVLAELPK